MAERQILAYDQKGDHERAIKEFTESIRLTSDDDRESLLIYYYNNRGASLREIGKYDESIDNLKRSQQPGTVPPALPYLTSTGA